MWSRAKLYLSRQVEELEKDRLLQLYGIFLSFILLLTYLFWRGPLVRIAYSDVAHCWPFLPGCQMHPLRLIGEQGVKAYWAATLAFASFSAVQFYRGKVKSAWAALLLAFTLKAFQQSVDYTLMGNYHYMPYLVAVAYLLIPAKRLVIPLLVVLFYVFAGLLKLNGEWLSGAAIPGRIPWMSETFFQVSLSYVVLLELVLVWGLLSRKLALRLATLAQLFLFHGLSWYIVGPFYPLVMGSLLGIFLLNLGKGTLPEEAHRYGSLPTAARAFLVVFLLMQLVPAVSGKDSSLHTGWRLSSLNMFDAAVQCQGSLYIKRKGETIEYIPDHSRSFGIRLRCDPYILLGEAQSLCREFSWDPEFLGVDAILAARRTRGTAFETVLRKPDVCGPKEGRAHEI